MLKIVKLFFVIFLLNLFSINAQDQNDSSITTDQIKQKNVVKKNLYQDPGFSHFVQYGQFFGLGNSEGNKYKLDYKFVFRVNRHISVGPALGIEAYPTGSSTIAVPVYFDLSYNISDEMYSPYLNLGTGYNIGYGYYYKVAGGINVASENGSYILNFGLQLDFINNDKKDVPHSLGIVVGLNF